MGLKLRVVSFQNMEKRVVKCETFLWFDRMELLDTHPRGRFLNSHIMQETRKLL